MIHPPAPRLATLHFPQGHFLGRMESLGHSLQAESLLETLIADVLKSSEIGGENLNQRQVRSSIANRLLDGFDGHLTTSKFRDILTLVALDALTRNSAAGRSTSYSLQSF